MLLRFLIVLLFFGRRVLYAETFGICWGRVARQPLPPGVVVQQLQDNNITRVKLFNSDPDVLRALAGTNIEVMVMLTNDEIQPVAQSMDAAQTWVDDNVQAWLPAQVNIIYVSVGNEPYLTTKKASDDYILAAFKNIYQALVNDGIDDVVKATVSFNSEIIQYSNPPSNASLASTWRTQLTEIAGIIYNSSSSFSVNIYPFYNFYSPSSALSPSLIFYDRASPTATGYTNVLDASFDAVLYALEKAGIPGDIDLIVGEVGWPTDGNSVSNISLSQEFNSGVIKKLLSGKGTIKRPNTVIRGFLFSLFDEDAKNIKPGAFERRWGIFDDFGVPKYNLDLTGGGDLTEQKLSATPGVYFESQQFCVAKSGADSTNLSLLFSNLCSNGNVSDFGDLADCTPVTANFTTPGFQCGAGSLTQQVSYAVNDYYQITAQNSSNCDWGGLAQVTSVNPSFGSCEFHVGIDLTETEQFTASSSSFSFYVLLYILSLVALLSTFL